MTGCFWQAIHRRPRGVWSKDWPTATQAVNQGYQAVPTKGLPVATQAAMQGCQGVPNTASLLILGDPAYPLRSWLMKLLKSTHHYMHFAFETSGVLGLAARDSSASWSSTFVSPEEKLQQRASPAKVLHRCPEGTCQQTIWSNPSLTFSLGTTLRTVVSPQCR